MGLFDEITCKYPLPVEAVQNNRFQTKDTPAQYMDQYEIREDGSLWHEIYDIEDHSDAAEWEAQHPGETAPEGTDRFCGCMSRVKKQWEACNFTGEIRFYESIGQRKPSEFGAGWVEFSSYFHNGKIQLLNLIEYREGPEVNIPATT